MVDLLDIDYVLQMPQAPGIPAARLAVIACVQRGSTTVNAIAESLSITDNAVRAHLTALERDGLIRRGGVRRSGQAGQPAAEYQLTSAGDIALSSAYPPALVALTKAIGERLDARAARSVFADAGRQLADTIPSDVTGSVAARATACAALIESLGGQVQIKHATGRATLVGTGCPLAAAVREEPGTCTIIEALLARHAGVRVVQHCDHGEHPRCRFELSPER
jgi:predicted ArsR family transcriptional regulator